jgi:hypothetical protein
MCGGMGMFGLLTVITVLGTAPTQPADPLVVKALGMATLGSAILLLPLSRLIPIKMKGSGDGPAMRRYTISAALSEAPCVVALVGALITRDPRFLGLFGLYMPFLILLFPSRRRWAALGGEVGDLGRMMRE